MVGHAADAAPPSTDRAPGPPLLEVRDLSLPPAVRGVSLTLRAGEVLGLAGLMGAGRTELARLLFGLDPMTSGSIRLRGEPLDPAPRRCRDAGMAFVTEDRRDEGLLPDSGVVANAGLASLPRFAPPPLRFVDRPRLREAVAAAAADVRLRAARLDRQPVRTLSGGNQQKVVLARWLMTHPSVLILDEPTRGIDVAARRDVERLIADLAAAGAGVLLISSEIDELTAACDRILVMAAGRIVASFDRPAFDREAILRAAFHRAPAGEAPP
jgi:ribose transport system ATP-binding protein